jgi:hypothetical protein
LQSLSGRIGNGSGDCVEQEKPIAKSMESDFLEVIVGQTRQQMRVDFVVPEIRLVLAEPETRSHPPTSMAAPHMA